MKIRNECVLVILLLAGLGCDGTSGSISNDDTRNADADADADEDADADAEDGSAEIDIRTDAAEIPDDAPLFPDYCVKTTTGFTGNVRVVEREFDAEARVEWIYITQSGERHWRAQVEYVDEYVRWVTNTDRSTDDPEGVEHHYFVDGLLTQMDFFQYENQDALIGTQTFSYDAAGYLIEDRIVNADGSLFRLRQWQTTYDDRDRLVEVREDWEGNDIFEERRVHHYRGEESVPHLIEVFDDDTPTEPKRQTYSYNDADQPIEMIEDIEDGTLRTQTWEYDDRGNLLRFEQRNWDRIAQ